MARALPMFPSVPQVNYDAEISGTAVRVTVRWLERTAGWYMDVKTPAGEVIVQGRRLSANRTPLEGLRILHRIGDSEVLLPYAGSPGQAGRLDPPTMLLLDRPAPAASDLGLTVTPLAE